MSDAVVIGITETKLDNTVYDSEVTIDGYNIVRKFAILGKHVSLIT